MRSRLSPLAIASLMVLAAVDSWLGLVVVGQLAGDSTTDIIATGTPPHWTLSVNEIAPPKPIDAYEQIVQRPVFFKTREPYVPPPSPPPAPLPVAAPPPPPVDPGLTLAGVTIAAGIRKAYFVSKLDTRGAWVSEGESIMGWTLESVRSTGTRLRQSDRVIEFELYEPR